MGAFNMFDSELITELAIFVLAIAFVMVFVIDALKKIGVIPEGKAGHWNQALSSVTGLLVFYLTYTGSNGRIEEAKEAALMIAGAVIYVITQILASKVWHDLLEWVQGKKPFPIQLTRPALPASTEPPSAEQPPKGDTGIGAYIR